MRGREKKWNFNVFFYMSTYSMILTKTHLQRHLHLIWRRKTSLRVSHVPPLYYILNLAWLSWGPKSIVELGARKLSWGPCWNTPSHHNNCHFNAWFLPVGPFQSRIQHLKNEGARKKWNFHVFFTCQNTVWFWLKRTCNAIYIWFGGEKRVCEFPTFRPCNIS